MGRLGWEEHVRTVRQFYKERRELFMQCADEHLKGLATYHAPSAGTHTIHTRAVVTDGHTQIHTHTPTYASQ